MLREPGFSPRRGTGVGALSHARILSAGLLPAVCRSLVNLYPWEWEGRAGGGVGLETPLPLLPPQGPTTKNILCVRGPVCAGNLLRAMVAPLGRAGSFKDSACPAKERARRVLRENWLCAAPATPPELTRCSAPQPFFALDIPSIGTQLACHPLPFVDLSFCFPADAQRV